MHGKPSTAAPLDGFKPFADSTGILTVGDVTVENQSTGVIVYGPCQIEISRDARGLALARLLASLAQEALKVLEAEDKAGTLPAVAAPPAVAKSDMIDNPLLRRD